MIAREPRARSSPGHHADRDLDRDHDSRGGAGLAGDAVSDRAVAAARRRPVLADEVPGRFGGCRRHGPVAASARQSFGADGLRSTRSISAC